MDPTTGSGDRDGESTATVTSAIAGAHSGIDCGMAYQAGGVVVVNGTCQGGQSALGGQISGYVIQHALDNGLTNPSDGFYVQSLDSPPSAAPQSLAVPPGTACGFKTNCPNTGENCMGFDPALSCPSGWTPRFAQDSNNTAGCGWVWCEYTDPNHQCTTSSCQLGVPAGTVCGITDSDPLANQGGTCLGNLTINGCPSGYVRSSSYFDDGRSAGHGLGWCTRQSDSGGGGGGGGGGCRSGQKSCGDGTCVPAHATCP